MAIKIPRLIKQSGEPTEQELHVFSDASSRAQAAVAYVRSSYANGEVVVRMLTSRNKVSPARKSESIPRLELKAAVIGVLLAKDICQAWSWDMSCTQYHVDSTAVLWWLRTIKPLSVFVTNRVCVILDPSRLDSWAFVPTELNPADLPSRGCSVQHLSGAT